MEKDEEEDKLEVFGVRKEKGQLPGQRISSKEGGDKTAFQSFYWKSYSLET